MSYMIKSNSMIRKPAILNILNPGKIIRPNPLPQNKNNSHVKDNFSDNLPTSRYHRYKGRDVSEANPKIYSQ